jgi:hypothetical protein
MYILDEMVKGLFRKKRPKQVCVVLYACHVPKMQCMSSGCSAHYQQLRNVPSASKFFFSRKARIIGFAELRSKQANFKIRWH